MAESIVIEKLEEYLAIEDILDLHVAEDPFAALRVDHVADNEALDAKAQEVTAAVETWDRPNPEYDHPARRQGAQSYGDYTLN